MSDELPSVGEFAAVYLEFMRAMSEAAQRPASPLVTTVREHLGTDPAELPVASLPIGVADRPNLQVALDAVLPVRRAFGLFNPHMHRMGGGLAQLFARFGPGEAGSQPVEYIDVELGDGRMVRCMA